MVNNSRKYKLNVSKLQSNGIGSSGCTIQYNLLDSFDFTINNVQCNYEQLTTEELKNLSTSAYEERVCNFLTHINLNNNEDSLIRERIVSESSYFDPSVNYVSQLNSDFIVYRFLSGVRIINIGKVSGVAQYKAYIEGENSENYTWQDSATFLDLDLTSIYVFEVRDYVGGEEKAKVTKRISIPTLVQSTTIPISNVLIYVNVSSSNISIPTSFSCGCVVSDPPLLQNECVSVDYVISAEASGDGSSYLDICCKKCGSAETIKICTVDNIGISPKTGNFVMCDGDLITYNTFGLVPSCGDCANSLFSITSIDGFDTTNPSIDQSKCEISLSVEAPREEVFVYVERCIETDTRIGGEIKFDPPLDGEKFANLTLDSNATSKLLGSSYFKVTCQTDGSGTFNVVYTNSSVNSQPNSETILINAGDRICYELGGNVPIDGSVLDVDFFISNVSPSNTIDVSIVPSGGSYFQGSGDSFYRCIESTPMTVSVCEINQHVSDYNIRSDGNINLSTTLNDIQVVNVCVCGHAQIQNNGVATAKLLCVPSGGTTPITIYEFEGTNLGNPDATTEISIRKGDQLGYELCVEANAPLDCGSAYIELFESYSYTGADPTISLTKPSKSIDIYTQEKEIVMYLNQTVNTQNEQYGEIVVNEEIPSQNWIDLEISSFASISQSTIPSNSCVIIECNGTELYSIDNDTSPQPNSSIVRIVGDDVLNYCLCGDFSNAGAAVESGINIRVSNNTVGVIPIIENNLGIGSGDTFVRETPQLDVIVDLIRTNSLDGESGGVCWCYSTGNFNVSESLTSIQEIDIYVCGRAEYGNGGDACVDFYCRGNGDPSFEKIFTFSGVSSLFTDNCIGNFTYRNGDSICYFQRVETSNGGDYGDASFKICAVDSNTGVNPTIDNNNCSDNIRLDDIIDAFNVYLNSVSIPNDCLASGSIIIDSNTIGEIPNGEYIDISLSSQSSGQFCGKSFLKIFCTPNGGSSSLKFENCYTDSQPKTTTIRVVSGDTLTYNLSGFTDNNVGGSSMNSNIQLTSVTGSAGINPLLRNDLGDGLIDSISFSEPLSSIEVSVDVDGSSGSGETNRSLTGTINLSESLFDHQCIEVCVCGSSEYVNNGNGYVRFFCQEDGIGTYDQILEFSATTSGASNCDGSFFMRKDDVVCYIACSTTSVNLDQSRSCFEICDVDSDTGLDPTIGAQDSINVYLKNEPDPIDIYVQRNAVSLDYVNGEIIIDPSIPYGENVDVTIEANANSCEELEATSSVVIFSDESGSFVPEIIVSNTTSPQPDTCTISVTGDTRLCYCMSGSFSNAGAEIDADFTIVNISSSSGIIPTLGNDGDSIYRSKAPDNITVSIPYSNEISGNTGGGGIYCLSSGYFTLSSPLSEIQEISVCFCGRACYECNGISCIEFSCKPSGSTTFTNFLSFSGVSTGSANCTGSFTYRKDDEICFLAYTEANDPKDCGDACFKLCSVESNSGVNPSIDSGNCLIDADIYCPTTPVNIYLNRTYTGTDIVCGEVASDIFIPTGEYVDLNISSITNREVCGTSYLQIWCQEVITDPKVPIFYNAYNGAQPKTTTIRLESGNIISYRLTGNTCSYDGSSYLSNILISSTVDSSTIESTLPPAGGSFGRGCLDAILDSNPELETTISLISAYDNPTVGICQSNGYVGFSNELNNEVQKVTVVLSGYSNAELGGYSQITLYCTPSGGTETIMNSYSTGTGSNQSFFDYIYICKGDYVCYNAGTNIMGGGSANVGVCIHTVNGNNTGVVPTRNGVSTFNSMYIDEP